MGVATIGQADRQSAPATPPDLSYAALFWRFLRFGMAAFGGPVAQIAMIRRALVEEERWIGSARFNRLLAVMQILPGPEAHELCVHLGIIARGRIGGFLAGLGFMLPGLALMMLVGWAYQGWLSGNAAIAPALLAIQLAVLAIIARAVQRIGQHILADKLLWSVAVASFAATLLHVPFWLPLLVGGAVYASAGRASLAGVIAFGGALLAALLTGGNGSWRGIAPTAAPAAMSAPTTIALFFAGLKGGLLTFGGAYTAIPYVRADTVGRSWLSEGSFVDGVGFAGVLPAPLVIFATFAGYIAGGPVGALAITAGMFLPAFAFSMLFFERLESVVDHPGWHRLLAGVGAAVVGAIAATLGQLALATAARTDNMMPALLIIALAALAVWQIKGKWVAPVIIALAAGAGWGINLR